MKIFLAGATGAVGHPTLVRLLADGHEVFAMTRSPERAHEIAKLGAEPIIADAMEASSIMEGVKKAQPEVVIEMLTSLPKVYTPQAMKEASEQDKKLRLVGGAHLQKAAIAAGARRYIVQSSAFWYAPGPGLATEETPFAFDATPGIAAGSRTYAEIEERVLQAGLEGVSLRFGFFYGPGTWFSPDGDVGEQVRHQKYYIVDGGHGVWNFVHVEDAAAAIAAALNCAPGIYNITNDTPVEMAVWLPAFAHFLGAPPPPKRTSEEERRLNGPDSVYYGTKLRGASNAKAKRELGFHPRSFEWLHRKIVTIDSPEYEVLERKADKIKEDEWELAREIAEQLIQTLKPFAPAAGLAAPQIGISKAIFIYSFDRDPKNLEVVINPSFEPVGNVKVEGWESCFSAVLQSGGSKIAKVARYETIKAAYQNLAGERIEKILEGFAAKVFQHEYDHLQGTLNIERKDGVVKTFDTKDEMVRFMQKVKKEDALRYKEPKEGSAGDQSV